ncbi:MAG: hypothetical protein U1E10_15995 [Bdellovibrionales bacterium]|nr:hypothetical protein [Bdellovibrionales bacterium]
MKPGLIAFALVFASSSIALAEPAQTESAPLQTYKCELVTRPPAEENYSPEFFHTEIVVTKTIKVSMNVGELDVFGSCGKYNIGKFDSAVDKYSEDPKTGAGSFAREFMSPIHINVPMWETATFTRVSGSTLPSGKEQMVINVKYDHNCQKYIDFDVNLNCIQQ